MCIWFHQTTVRLSLFFVQINILEGESWLCSLNGSRFSHISYSFPLSDNRNSQIYQFYWEFSCIKIQYVGIERETNVIINNKCTFCIFRGRAALCAKWLVHTLYCQKYWHPPSLEQKNALPICGRNIIHVFKNCISISVATVLEVSKMTEPHMYKSLVFGDEFWLKVCIYSHTRGVKTGIRTWFYADQSRFFHTDSINNFLFEPCLIHRDIVMLE